MTENLVMFISENLRECMYSCMYMPKKTKYEEQMQNSDGLFQRLWSVEDREGTNIRYLVYAYIRSN